MAERLGERGFEVQECDSGEKAIQLLEQFAFDFVITDLRLPGVDGTRVIEAALERYPGIVAIVITGYGTMKDAVLFEVQPRQVAQHARGQSGIG